MQNGMICVHGLIYAYCFSRHSYSAIRSLTPPSGYHAASESLAAVVTRDPPDCSTSAQQAAAFPARPDGKFGGVSNGGTVPPDEVPAGGVASTAARVPARRLLHEVRADDPVSSSVFRLARTAGHPSEIAGSTALPGAKPSWVTGSLTTPWPTSSMSKVTLERASARQVAAVASSMLTAAAHSGVIVCQV